MVIDVKAIPGFKEHLASLKINQARNREVDFLGRSHVIGGIKIRTMTVMDFVILCNMGNPIVHKVAPEDDDTLQAALARFLRILQDPPPYQCRLGWLSGWRFGRRVRHIKVPAKELVKQCFDYVDAMFRDAPSVPEHAGEAVVSCVAYWCFAMRSSIGCSEDEVLRMQLPKLFQYLRVAYKSNEPERQESNKTVDDVFNKVCELLQSGECTPDDLLSGRFEMPWSSIKS